MSDKIDYWLQRLHAIQINMERIVGSQQCDEPTLTERLTRIGLTLEEAEAWQVNVPRFTKRIVTPLNSRRTKRRSDVTSGNKVYIFCYHR